MSRHPLTAKVPLLGYDLAARTAAVSLRLGPHVDGVYLTGSLTRPETVMPGVSDIDLVVAAQLPELEEELALQQWLSRWQRFAYAAAPLFHNLDYFDLTELPYLCAFGNTWSLAAETRWKLLAGRARTLGGATRPLRAVRLEGLVAALRRWCKASAPLLLLPPEDEGRRRRKAERVLMDVLGGVLGHNRLTPLPELLDDAVDYVGTIPAAEAVAERSAGVSTILSVALHCIDRAAMEASRDWGPAWTVTGEAPLVCADARDQGMAWWQHLRGGSFRSLAVVPQGPGGDDALALLVARDELTPVQIVEAACSEVRTCGRASVRTFRWSPWPVVMTPAMVRVAACLTNAPFVGAYLAHGGGVTFGEPLVAPAAPVRADMDALIRGRVVEQFVRLRGRLLRARRDHAARREELDTTIDALLPALSRAHDSGTITLSRLTEPSDRHFGDDRERVRRIRTWIDERKRVLAPELAR